MTAPLLVDPSQQFLEQDPTILHDPNQLLDPTKIPQTAWEQLPAEHGSYKIMGDVMVGIGVAYLLLVRLVGNDLKIRQTAWDVTRNLGFDTLTFSVRRATASYRNAWTYMLNPAISHAMQLGTTANLSYQDEVAYATSFSHQIFDYINDTNADALVKAYQSQLTEKWHPDVAWARAVAGYGLEERSMKQYLKMITQGDITEIVPTAARLYVQRALQDRAQRLGYNESHRAKELGKTLVWMTQYSKGELPVDVQRRWLTAEDERVCKICGPMDRVQVPMQEQFELPDGNKIWAPGVHPNCRCQVELSYPELVGKRYNPREPRDEQGRWSRIETRRAQAPPREALPVPERAGRLQQLLEADPDWEVTPEQAEAAVERGVITREEADELLREQAEPQVVTQAPVRGAPLRTDSPAIAVVQAPTRAVTEAPVRIATEAPVRVRAEAPTKAPARTEAVMEAPLRADKPPNPWDHFLRPRYPMHIFVNDLDQTLAQRGKFQWGGDNSFEFDDVIDMTKYGEYQPRDATIGVRVETMPSIRDMANYAADRYTDKDAFDIWDRTEKDAYHATAQEFYENAVKMVGNPEDEASGIVGQLEPDALKEIYRRAGDELSPSIMPVPDLRSNLKREVNNNGKLRASYLDYLEHFEPTKVPGWQDLESYNSNLPIVPHYPAVLVFDRAIGHYLETPNQAIVYGKYRVKSIELVPAKPELGLDAPSNIGGIRLIHLEPVGAGWKS